jgi:hypothetical protein
MIDPFVQARMEGPCLNRPDEPWDSEYNNGVAKQWDGEFYTCPAIESSRREAEEPVVTSYIGITGIGVDAATLPIKDRRCGVFGYTRITNIKDITDGTAQTIMVAETMWQNGPFSQGGFSTSRGFDRDNLPSVGRDHQFGGLHPGTFNITLANGSARSVNESIDPRVLEALATIAGGEQVVIPE